MLPSFPISGPTTFTAVETDPKQTQANAPEFEKYPVKQQLEKMNNL